MTKSRESDELSKPTFEACFGCQEELRKFINKHTETNTPVSTTNERDKFFALLASSTLGEGSSMLFSVLIGEKIYSIKSVELAARWLADQTEPSIFIPGRFGNRASPVVDISILWRALLEHLYLIFPVALSKALSMSKEDTRNKQSDGYRVS